MLVDRYDLDALTGRFEAERIVIRSGRTRRVNFVKRLFGFPELRDWLLAAGFASVTGYGEDTQPLTAEASWAMAVLALSLRDPGAAYAALAPMIALVERDGVTEPILVMSLADGIEALVGLGHLDRAEHLTGTFKQAARRLHRGWALAQAERCRALLFAARGNLASAARAASAACHEAERLELRLEYARTLLVAGEIERRSRRKRLACDLLGRALEIFETGRCAPLGQAHPR
jgi:hypothetical protein